MPDNFAGLALYMNTQFDYIAYLTGDAGEDEAAVEKVRVANNIEFFYLDERARLIDPSTSKVGFFWSYEKQF